MTTDVTDHVLPTSKPAFIARAFVAISFVLFLVSLSQDGFTIDRADNPRAWSSCFGLLLFGWIAVLDGVWAWLANPILAITWIVLMFSKRRWLALCFGVVSFGFAISFLWTQEILSDEAGNHSRITGYGPGYWCWIASIAVAVLGSLVSAGTTGLSQTADPHTQSH